MTSDEELRIKARKRAEEKASFYTHLGIYTIVNLFLIAIWWFTGGPRVFPWFIFILFGWGIGLASHLLSVYRGEGFIDKMAEREYEKLKKQED